MKKSLLALSVVSAILAGCGGGGGGDVKIAPSTNVVDSNNTTVNNPPSTGGGGGGATNPCASYTKDGTTRQGFLSGVNCIYGTDFVDFNNPLTVDLTIPDLPNDGAHIFRGSIFVGANQKGNQNNFTYKEGGQGPKLNIDAGATIALESSADFILVHRGSQIFARGTASKPITFTSTSDLEGTIAFDAVSQWGGLAINGFGITNKCAYTGNLAADGFSGLTLTNNTCDVTIEGTEGLTEGSYGGNNNRDNSGILEYVVVKHAGAEITPDNELNGITLGGVGSGTTLRYIQVYSAYDDGIEFFGGAADLSYYIGLYARDDSIDLDEGYRGKIEHALVIQSLTDGAHCIEADGVGSWTQARADDMVARNLHTQPLIRNLTCIVTPTLTTLGATHEAGAGIMVREGIAAKMENILLTTAFQPDPSGTNNQQNYCLRHRQQAPAIATLTSSIIACADLYSDSSSDTTTWAPTQTGNIYYETNVAGQNPSISTNNGLKLLNGFFSVPISQMEVGGVVPNITPTGGQNYIGGVTAANNWTQGWTYGLYIQNWGEPLWVTNP